MNKSDITRDFCMLKGPLAKKGTTGGGIPLPPSMSKPGNKNLFTSNIFCATPPGRSRNRCWFGMTPQGAKRANARHTAW